MSSRALVIAVLLLGVVAAGFPVDAQQAPKIPRIGLLTAGTRASAGQVIDSFRQGLPELARELVGLKVNVIVATTDGAIAAVKRETQTIPIVMTVSSDPTGTGLVASLARPGGNVTGLSTISPELSGKRLTLLKEAVPGLSRVALLWNPDVRGNLLDYRETEGAARSLGLEFQSVEVSRVEDLDRAFSTLTKGRAQALVLPAGTPAVRAQIMSFALRNRLPSIAGNRNWTDA